MPKTNKNIEARFWEKVETGGGCWNWTAHTNLQGYGRFNFFGKCRMAHRVAWKLVYGEIPEKLCVLHHCDNTSCVRPDHLFLGTQADNVLDSVNKGRHINPRFEGSKNPGSKLSSEDVKSIRSLYKTGNYSLQDLGNRFGIVFQHVSSIVNQKRWSHI